jgi:predicted RNA methylase
VRIASTFKLSGHNPLIEAGTDISAVERAKYEWHNWRRREIRRDMFILKRTTRFHYMRIL